MGMMMGGAQRHAMATFDTNKDGTLSPDEMTAGIGQNSSPMTRTPTARFRWRNSR